jgi:hypothetical protein
VFTSVAQGEVPASGGGTTNFLRADGTWAVPPGSGGADIKTVAVDLGASPVTEGSFVITDAAIGVSSIVRVWQGDGPYAGKGSGRDESEMDAVDCFAVPAAGSATVHWQVRPQGIHFDRFGVGKRLQCPVVGSFNFDYLVG